MSNQPPYGQGPWQQQPPTGPPPGQGPPGQAGPPQYGAPPPGGYPPPGGPPPGGSGGPPSWPGAGPPQYGGPPPGKSKLLPILAVIGVVIVLAGGGVLLYFLVLSDDDDEASGSDGGGSSSVDYCTLLDENYDYFEDMSSGAVDPDEIERAVGIIHDLRDSAPEELADEWAQLDDPFRNLEAALDEAGLTWTDVDEVEDPEELPQSVRDAAETFINDLTSIDQEAVGGAIETHARDECGIEIEETPTP